MKWLCASRQHSLPIETTYVDFLKGCGAVKKYKLKTHKGTAKRIKLTSTGLVMRQHASRTKYRRKKRGEIRRELERQVLVAAGEARKMRRLLPYGKRPHANEEKRG